MIKSKVRLIVLAIPLLGGAAVATSSAYAQKAVLEEIVVTAQKRTQNIQDVAAAVSVLSGEHIDEYNILNFQDLERISAGFSLTQANPRNVTISLRGVTFDPESGTASAVDVYQNNVVQRGDNIFGAMYDMERVEVLRGAQGSVQGATSPAGAILLHTKKADLDTFSGYAQSTYTDANEGLNLQAALSIPIISDTLGVRISVYTDENDGNNIVNLTTGNVQDRGSTSFRGSLRYQPSENLEVSLAHQSNDEEIMGTPALEGTRTNGSAGFPDPRTPPIPCSAIAAVDGLDCISLTRDDNRALASGDAFSNRKADITTLNLDWTFGKHQLSYAFGKTTSEKVSRTENDVSNNLPLRNLFYERRLGVTTDTDYLTHQGTTTEVDADTHELRFASIDNPTWNYMVGLYYNNQETRTRFDSWTTAARYIPLVTVNNPLIPVTFTGGHFEGINLQTGGVIPFDREVTAIFTAHSFQFNEQATLEAAVRYQELERYNATPIRFVSFHQRENISVQNAMATGVPPMVATQTAEGILLGTLTAIEVASNIDGIAPEFQRPESDSITGSVRFKYDFSDNLKSYLSWNRAFRSGGISVVPGENLPNEDLLFEDEFSDSLELGAKIIFLEGAGEINIALFHQVFDGFLGYVTDLEYLNPAMVTARNPDGRDALTGGLVYNGDATFSGIDLDWRLIFGANYHMGGSFNYTKAEFDDAQIPCNVRTGDEQLGRCSSSERVPGSPEFSANLFAEYSIPIGGGASRFFIRGNAKYNDGIVATRATDVGDDPGETDSFVLIDLFLGWDHDNWEVSIWAKNLLDDDSLLDLTNPGDNFDTNGDFSIVRRQQERSFGATAKFLF